AAPVACGTLWAWARRRRARTRRVLRHRIKEPEDSGNGRRGDVLRRIPLRTGRGELILSDQTTTVPDSGAEKSAPKSRLLSGVEFLVGAAIVIGHNVFRVLPNEVPILFVLGIVSIRLRNGTLSAMGFKRPKSWPVCISIAAGVAALRILLSEFVIDPITAR